MLLLGGFALGASLSLGDGLPARTRNGGYGGCGGRCTGSSGGCGGSCGGGCGGH